MDFAHAPARQNDLVAGLVGCVVGALDGAREIDAGNMGVFADQTAARPDAEPVLVVDRRILDRHRHIALRQLIFADLLDRGRCLAALFVLLDDQCLKHHELSFLWLSAILSGRSGTLVDSLRDHRPCHCNAHTDIP